MGAHLPMATDRLERPMRDLRVSVTDRCNFRCGYCMPKEVFGPTFRFLPRADVLRLEEVARLARICASLGVRKVRLTGGEPLLRRGLVDLIRMLAAIPGVEVALTTNGALLAGQAQTLAEAGLSRVTVSLDALDDAVFRRMNDADFPVAPVLEGIDAAAAAGLSPVKINAVVRRGWNEGEVIGLVRRFKGTGHIVRFIEFMDVGTTNGWRLDDVVSAAELVGRIRAKMAIEPVEPGYRGEVAKRWRHADGSGEIGFITSVTRPFCGDCTRARLSAEGRLYTCLFSGSGADLRGPLRDGAGDAALAEIVRATWSAREDRYSELRSSETEGLPKIEMSYIGG